MALLLLLTLGLCGLWLNARRFSSRQLRDVEPAAALDDLNAEAAWEHLRAAIRVPTVSPRTDPAALSAFEELHDTLAQAFPRTWEQLELGAFGAAGPSLVVHWPGTSNKLPILLMSHLDVVPASDADWTHPPFDAVRDDTFIWGRGALDVKSGACAILEACEYLLGLGFQPERSIYLVFGHDEETGGESGNARIARAFAERGTRFWFVLDEGGAIIRDAYPSLDRPVALIAVDEKASARIRLAARGAGGHGSVPTADAAVYRLAEAIRRISEHPMPGRLDTPLGEFLDWLAPELPPLERTILSNRWIFDLPIRYKLSTDPAMDALLRTTCNVTQVSAGEAAANVTPSLATALLDVRILPGDSLPQIERRLATLFQGLDIEIQVEAGSVGVASQPRVADEPSFQVLQRTIHRVFPDVLVAPGLTSVTTDSRHYRGIADRVYRFLPMRLWKDDLHRIHGVDERIELANYLEMVHFFVRLMEAAAAPGSGW